MAVVSLAPSGMGTRLVGLSCLLLVGAVRASPAAPTDVEVAARRRLQSDLGLLARRCASDAGLAMGRPVAGVSAHVEAKVSFDGASGAATSVDVSVDDGQEPAAHDDALALIRTCVHDGTRGWASSPREGAPKPVRITADVSVPFARHHDPERLAALELSLHAQLASCLQDMAKWHDISPATAVSMSGSISMRYEPETGVPRIQHPALRMRPQPAPPSRPWRSNEGIASVASVFEQCFYPWTYNHQLGPFREGEAVIEARVTGRFPAPAELTAAQREQAERQLDRVIHRCMYRAAARQRLPAGERVHWSVDWRQHAYQSELEVPTLDVRAPASPSLAAPIQAEVARCLASHEGLAIPRSSSEARFSRAGFIVVPRPLADDITRDQLSAWLDTRLRACTRATLLADAGVLRPHTRKGSYGGLAVTVKASARGASRVGEDGRRVTEVSYTVEVANDHDLPPARRADPRQLATAVRHCLAQAQPSDGLVDPFRKGRVTAKAEQHLEDPSPPSYRPEPFHP